MQENNEVIDLINSLKKEGSPKEFYLSVQLIFDDLIEQGNNEKIKLFITEFDKAFPELELFEYIPSEFLGEYPEVLKIYKEYEKSKK